MLVGSELKKIKYVAVEVVRKNATKISEVECGLFMGICTKKDKSNNDHRFLVLMVSKSSVRMYNLSEYDIVTVDAVDVDSRYMTVFTIDSKDQKSSRILLDEITEELEKDKRIYINDPSKELIDIETYIDYPDSILEIGSITKDREVSNNTKKETTKTVYNNYGYTTTQKDPVVTNIRRKGRLPKAASLLSMKDKVARLASGEFKLKNIPVPNCDLEDITAV